MGLCPIPLLMYSFDCLDQLRFLLHGAGHGFDLFHDSLRMDGSNFLRKFCLFFRSCRIIHDNAQRTYPPPW